MFVFLNWGIFLGKLWHQARIECHKTGLSNKSLTVGLGKQGLNIDLKYEKEKGKTDFPSRLKKTKNSQCDVNQGGFMRFWAQK